MAESQSRFSIIDELIKRKADTQNDILKAEQSVRDAEFIDKKWEQDVNFTRASKKENYEKLQADVKAKVVVLQSNLLELEKGITAVQSISTIQSK